MKIFDYYYFYVINNQEEYNLKQVQQQLISICEQNKKPKQIDGLEKLRAHQYFQILEIVRSKGLKQSKEGGRLGALLQNLMERKNNNWKKHHVEAEKPSTLKDVNKEDEPVISPEERAKLQSKQANQKMKKVFKKLIEGDNNTLKELDSVYKTHTFNDFIGAYFTQVSDDKKDNIPKRLQLFDTILSKYLDKNNFSDAWKKNFQNLSFLGSEFPYLAAALAKILIKYVESKKGSYNDFFIKYDEDDQEDEFFFMQNLFQKLYHYTKEEQLKSVITPKQKLSQLL